MDQDKEYRKAIAQLVREYYKRTRSRKGFRPGETPIPYAARVFDEKELINVVDAGLDFWLTAGRYANALEKKLAKFIGCRYAMLVNSGSSANLLAVTALTSPLLEDRRLKSGDEVITTACGFPTTVNPIIQNGFVPVFVDCEPGTLNPAPRAIAKAVTSKTKAIVLAHTLGNPVDVDPILKIARQHDLWFIEDNCDAIGSEYKGRRAGTFGHLSTYSFYPAHHITMGEGGAVLTSDPLLKKIVLSLRDWGRDCWCEPGQDNTCKNRFSRQHGQLPFGYDHKYVYSHIGYNLKITDLQAAIGLAQMDKLEGFIAARRDNFQFFLKHLKKYERYLLLPKATKKAEPAWFGFPVMIKKNPRFSRLDIVAYLEKHKIATRMLFGGNLTKQPAYTDVRYRIAGDLKHTDAIMNNLFWFGVYPGLTSQMREYVVSVFKDFFKGLK